jgi:SIR2-like domain
LLLKMRFLPDGPDVPDELVAAQERGQTIFVCGAGVSKTAGLPLFPELVESVYQELGEDRDRHPAEREGMDRREYDRVLRCLERRLAPSDLRRQQPMRDRIRSAVRQALSPPKNAELVNHLALLDLSLDAEGRPRVLTTNFDTVFERAWFAQHAEPILSHAGPAMPQPKVSGFGGVLHLHGRLADSDLRLDETDLVLTSAEFGDAYLRSGWASRYVYDLVRTHTLVLVGYQADDPPMRYLLEALEADRERYPDLQQVYAFASSTAGEEEIIAARWEAKGVTPVIYIVNRGDHSPLYETLREWKHYAGNPTAWRRERLRGILSDSPLAVAEELIEECTSLLAHGDAPQLLGKLSPEAVWLPVLVERRAFDDGQAHPGEWIAKRINDPEMIRACAALAAFDERTYWLIDRAVARERQTLSSIRLKAWQLMLAAKGSRTAIDLDFTWYTRKEAVKQGETGYEVRQLVASILRPRLKIRRAWREGTKHEEPEALHHLLRREFRSADSPQPDEILDAWPRVVDQEVALFRVLDRILVEALEEASDADFLDETNWDVPSVAVHDQNAHRSGFYPITRALADVWQRISAKEHERAAALAVGWKNSPFLLMRRLYLYALSSSEIFTADEAASAVLALSDDDFWLSRAQVEIMRLLVGRWHELDKEDRDAIEARLAEGIPRGLFPADPFETDGKWDSIWDSAVFKRLNRISAAGGELSPASLQTLQEISARHPKWQPGPGDRDDFMTWLGETRVGPQGHPELLADVADGALIAEAMRLQREKPFEEDNIWQLFCSADPDRALRALSLEADAGNWQVEAWRSFIWAAGDKAEGEFQFELTDLLAKMPDAHLGELLSSATSWLQKVREILSASDRPGGPQFFRLWDRFADLTYGNAGNGEPGYDDDPLTRALNEPGGILAWSLLDSLIASEPRAGTGLGLELTPRFSRVAAAGRSGLLARVCLAHRLAYLDAIDPMWTGENLVPRLAWEHPEAPALWKAQAVDRIGSAHLFNAIKPAMLEAFERQHLSDHEFESLVARLISVCLWHRRGEAADYELSPAEVRGALSVGPACARQNASWQFWQLMRDKCVDPPVKAQRWNTIIGPLFLDVWPLDVKLQSEEISHNLTLMALECEDAFPEAVNAIVPLLVPYRLYELSGSLRLEEKHDVLVSQYPAASIRLADALIDPAVYPLPHDLPTFLEECVRVDPSVARKRGYIRLSALRRQLGA